VRLGWSLGCISLVDPGNKMIVHQGKSHQLLPRQKPFRLGSGPQYKMAHNEHSGEFSLGCPRVEERGDYVFVTQSQLSLAVASPCKQLAVCCKCHLVLNPN
jgi:hypothetical protein